MFGPKIHLTQELAEKLRVASQVIGAASMEEFAVQLLEEGAGRVLASTGKKTATAAEVEEIANSLKGLGYIE